MILDKFRSLSISTQTTIVSQFGLPVAELVDDHFIYLLYQYSDFYVEIKCLRSNYNFNSLQAFSVKSCYLDIYLNAIKISPDLLT